VIYQYKISGSTRTSVGVAKLGNTREVVGALLDYLEQNTQTVIAPP
jgi:hypothetical protein